MHTILRTAAAVLVVHMALLADFSYVDTTRITGGSLAGAMKFVGKLGGGGLHNMESRVYIKGDRMATVFDDSATIIDLGAETFTEVNFKKKQYSVMTFQQMREAMEQAQEEMRRELEKSKKKNPEMAETEIRFSVDIEDPKRSTVIGGYEAKEMILLIKTEFENREKGASGAMNIASNMWLAKNIAGSKESEQFMRKMAEKLAWSPNSSILAGAAMQPGMGEAMAKLQEQAANMEGVTVRQIIRMGGSVEGLEAIAAQDQDETAAANEKSSMKEGLKSIGGSLGGFGGFGRKKKPQEEPAARDDGGAMKASQAGVLIEMTTESSEFSTAAIPNDRFEIPDGFKQVESEMAKRTK